MKKHKRKKALKLKDVKELIAQELAKPKVVVIYYSPAEHYKKMLERSKETKAHLNKIFDNPTATDENH